MPGLIELKTANTLSRAGTWVGVDAETQGLPEPVDAVFLLTCTRRGNLSLRVKGYNQGELSELDFDKSDSPIVRIGGAAYSLSEIATEKLAKVTGNDESRRFHIAIAKPEEPVGTDKVVAARVIEQKLSGIWGLDIDGRPWGELVCAEDMVGIRPNHGCFWNPALQAYSQLPQLRPVQVCEDGPMIELRPYDDEQSLSLHGLTDRVKRMRMATWLGGADVADITTLHLAQAIHNSEQH